MLKILFLHTRKKYIVDNHYYLESPYETYSIYIATIPGIEVTFDGESVVNEDGYISLDEVLEAEHDLTFTLEGMIEPLTTKITVNDANTYFDFYDFNIKEKFQEELYKLLQKFNDADIVASKEKNANYYKPYVTDSYFNKNLKDYFDSSWWYETTSSEYSMEPIKVELASIDKVYFTVREDWYTISEAVIEKTFKLNGDVKLENKVNYEFIYEIIMENGSWKINNAEVLNSKGKYLDKNGKWINY